MSAAPNTVTVTWTDPPVGAGQAALATLNVYAALDTNGNAGPLVLLGTALPGAQTYTSVQGALASGSTFYFCVKAVDVNGLVSQQSGWAGPAGPIGGPGAPTNVQVTINNG